MVLSPEWSGDVPMIATTDRLVTGVADVVSVAHECILSDDLLSPFALLYFLYCSVLCRLFRSRIPRSHLILCFLHGLLLRCFNLVSVFNEISNLIKEMSHLNHCFIRINLYWLCLTWIALYLVNSVLSARPWPGMMFLVTKLRFVMGLVVCCKFRLNPAQTVRSKKVPCRRHVTSQLGQGQT